MPQHAVPIERVLRQLLVAVGQHRDAQPVAALEPRVVADVDDLDDRAPGDQRRELGFELLAKMAAGPAVQRQRLHGRARTRTRSAVSLSVRRRSRGAAASVAPSPAAAPTRQPRSDCVANAPIAPPASSAPSGRPCSNSVLASTWSAGSDTLTRSPTSSGRS